MTVRELFESLEHEWSIPLWRCQDLYNSVIREVVDKISNETGGNDYDSAWDARCEILEAVNEMII